MAKNGFFIIHLDGFHNIAMGFLLGQYAQMYTYILYFYTSFWYKKNQTFTQAI